MYKVDIFLLEFVGIDRIIDYTLGAGRTRASNKRQENKRNENEDSKLKLTFTLNKLELEDRM